MYVPRIELQYYNGQLYCPYCVQEIIAEENRMKHTKKEKHGEHREHEHEHEHCKRRKEHDTISGVCERCGNHSEELYWVRGQGLCIVCAEHVEADRPPRFGVVIMTRVRRSVHKIVKQAKRIALRLLGRPDTKEDLERKHAAKEISKKLGHWKPEKKKQEN